MDTKNLISKMAIQLGRPAEEVEAEMSALFELIVESVKSGDSVSIPGFGSFEPKLKKERVATHPSSGKKLLVPPKMSMVFKPSALLKQKVRK